MHDDEEPVDLAGCLKMTNTHEANLKIMLLPNWWCLIDKKMTCSSMKPHQDIPIYITGLIFIKSSLIHFIIILGSKSRK